MIELRLSVRLSSMSDRGEVDVWTKYVCQKQAVVDDPDPKVGGPGKYNLKVGMTDDDWVKAAKSYATRGMDSSMVLVDRWSPPLNIGDFYPKKFNAGQYSLALTFEQAIHNGLKRRGEVTVKGIWGERRSTEHFFTNPETIRSVVAEIVTKVTGFQRLPIGGAARVEQASRQIVDVWTTYVWQKQSVVDDPDPKVGGPGKYNLKVGMTDDDWVKAAKSYATRGMDSSMVLVDRWSPPLNIGDFYPKKFNAGQYSLALTFEQAIHNGLKRRGEVTVKGIWGERRSTEHFFTNPETIRSVVAEIVTKVTGFQRLPIGGAARVEQASRQIVFAENGLGLAEPNRGGPVPEPRSAASPDKVCVGPAHGPQSLPSRERRAKAYAASAQPASSAKRRSPADSDDRAKTYAASAQPAYCTKRGGSPHRADRGRVRGQVQRPSPIVSGSKRPRSPAAGARTCFQEACNVTLRDRAFVCAGGPLGSAMAKLAEVLGVFFRALVALVDADAQSVLAAKIRKKPKIMDALNDCCLNGDDEDARLRSLCAVLLQRFDIVLSAKTTTATTLTVRWQEASTELSVAPWLADPTGYCLRLSSVGGKRVDVNNNAHRVAFGKKDGLDIMQPRLLAQEVGPLPRRIQQPRAGRDARRRRTRRPN